MEGKMKKLLILTLTSFMSLGLIACKNSASPAETTAAESTEVSQNTEASESESTEVSESATEEEKAGIPETITIQSYNAEKELVDLEVPYDPERIAILDMASLDIIDALGLGERVVGSATTTIEYLLDYVPGDSNDIANLGTIKNADLVEVAACEPDVIFIGGRLSSVYNDLSEIAPVVYLATDSEIGVVESTEKNARTIASIFGKEAEVDAMVADFDERITAIKEQYEGKNAIVGMYSGSSYNVLGNDGRCSIIGVELGFNNMGVDAGEITSTHGNEASWETIVNLNPEYMFVLDRNTAISSTDGNPAVKDAIENELIKGLDVYKNGNIIYLAHPNVWYTAEGGIQALDVMLQDVESALMN